MADQNDAFHATLTRLYTGRSRRARLFRYGVLTFDIATLAFFVVASMLSDASWIYGFELVIAIVIVADLGCRFWIAPNKPRYLMELTTWADLFVVATLLAPAFIESVLFLRVLRALRLLRSYHVLRDLRKDNAFVRRNEDIFLSVINLGVFIFVVTALVFVLQVRANPQINTYIDALYFTVTTLTTTGFGDITLQGSSGRLLAVAIMVIGVALFLRLVQTIFRPAKVRYRCPDCGLNRHDTDAVHCKHCGRILQIETEGGG
ncbi:MAG: ion channel [Methyloligellaceae bacterium]